MKKVVEYLLLANFFIVYFKLFEKVWVYLPFQSSVGVLAGTLVVFIMSLILAIWTLRGVAHVLTS
ncbi:hypothetical protein A33I_01640 [Alkalihalophilus marmarensis DSM 21297]|uniref:Uncharacterized protein n=1 Tax=Alkalihalophilus marmarensis DSM 21297 TaxID=1188261 RepID=U6SJ69_9BACI|nr:hypothetical protein A33I_01640 [Alkalihalophilus marmarensis DSM 21297]